MKSDKVWDGDMEMEGNKENGEVGREVSEIGVENRREDIRMCEKRVKEKKAERKGKKHGPLKAEGKRSMLARRCWEEMKKRFKNRKAISCYEIRKLNMKEVVREKERNKD